jgi:16S rRNA (cytidine1402-2'-O)-methyltransferase
LYVFKKLEEGKHLAFVTDAGTPAVSDPGGMLVRAVFERFGGGIRAEAVPGPSAITAALSIAGLPSDRFCFYGFPPHKKGRRAFFKRIAEHRETSVFYESPHRIIKTLTEFAGEAGGNREVVVARELTKLFETVYRGRLEQVLQELAEGERRGEFVVVVRGV